MTVSPQWPQDGNRQPSVGGSGVESGDSVDSPTLPPTLFQLPNLNQEARDHAQTDQAFIDQALIDQALIDQAPVSRAVQGSPKSDDELRSPTPPAVSNKLSTPASPASEAAPSTATAPENSRSPERNPIPRDQPAGRSWMERIGSHSVVVVLLLVVIAAGLVIGRNSRNQGFDSSLADSSDLLLDIDEGTELELPLPKHGDNHQSKFAASGSSAHSQQPGVSALEPSDSLTSGIVVTDVTTSPNRDAAVDGASAADIFADSAAWLSDPRTDLAATGGADANLVEVDKLSEESTNVDFLAASSRIPGETSLNSLPTLDELDDQPSGAGEKTMADGKTPAPRFSKTPAPIIDWQPYLPREESASADTNVPFTSN